MHGAQAGRALARRREADGGGHRRGADGDADADDELRRTGLSYCSKEARTRAGEDEELVGEDERRLPATIWRLDLSDHGGGRRRNPRERGRDGGGAWEEKQGG